MSFAKVEDLTETAKSVGHDPEASQIKSSQVKAFKSKGETFIVHCAGKLFPSLVNSTEKVVRLPVAVTVISTGDKAPKKLKNIF